MVWHRRPQFSHSWRGDNYSRWGAPEGPCDQHTHGLWFCTNCDVGPQSAAPVPTEVTATTAPSSPPTTGPAGDMGPDLGTNPPKDITARARRSTHDQSNIMHWEKSTGLLCCKAHFAWVSFLVCLFLNILAVERVTVLFSSPHMLYSFPSHTCFLLTQLTIVCFSHRNISFVCPQTVS